MAASGWGVGEGPVLVGWCFCNTDCNDEMADESGG